MIPFRGYKAVTLWPFIFARKELDATDMNHECIHGRQQLEMLLLPFLLWYGVEWVIRLIQYGDGKKAYRNISFEREAYEHEDDTEYLKHRGFFSSVKYVNTSIQIF